MAASRRPTSRHNDAYQRRRRWRYTGLNDPEEYPHRRQRLDANPRQGGQGTPGNHDGVCVCAPSPLPKTRDPEISPIAIPTENSGLTMRWQFTTPRPSLVPEKL